MYAVCSVIFCEATAIYGVILSIIIANKTQLPSDLPIPTAGPAYKKWELLSRFAGYSLFWSGVSVGLTNLGSGYVRIVKSYHYSLCVRLLLHSFPVNAPK